MKKVLYLLLVIIALAYAGGFFVSKKLHTEITINADSQVVWEHLTDFEKYPEWNPFVKTITGELAVGSQIEVSIQPSGKEAMSFKPKLLVVEKNQELRWLGRVLLPKLFDGEHYFIITANPDGTTHFVQGEHFSGILVLLLWGGMEQDTKKGFEAMNKALKEISEAT